MVFEDMASKYFFCLTYGMTRARSCWPSAWHSENRFANLVHTCFEISVWIKRMSINFAMMKFCFILCHQMLQTPNEGINQRILKCLGQMWHKPWHHQFVCFLKSPRHGCKWSRTNRCIRAKIQQTKMLVTCQRFCDLFLFGLVWQCSEPL